MKCTYALPVLLVGLSITALPTPAAAQTPLLEVDYQNATIFHVLSDGRVLLPLGAAAGYVLTSDGDGYGTWQAVSGNGGLTMVTSDATLTGDGTMGNPLGVSVPLTLTGSANGIVQGVHTTGHYGVLGHKDYGVSGTNANGNLGYFGHKDYGAYGEHANGHSGVLGGATQGAVGLHANGHYGILGGATYGAGGVHTSGNNGLLGNEDYGVWGTNANGNLGYFGSSSYGVRGEHTNGHYGYLGSGSYGAYGRHNNGNHGYLGSASSGAYGEHANGHFGRLGSSDYGAYGEHGDGHFGYLGENNVGAYGEHANGHYGYLGDHFFAGGRGVYGQNANGNFGYLGGAQEGIHGEHANGHRGKLGSAGSGVYGFGDPRAGYFQGDVEITGTLTGGSAAFKVDHPLDPENQYLVHSTVESPDMKNVYDGNVTTDDRGEAVVELPAYFEALNRDFCYQLTVMGQFAQAIVAEKIRDNRFVIRTDVPSVEVSWQVTGIRQDPWAEEHRIVVEETKPAREQGYYLYPALYGQPEERSIEWARDPEGMRAIKEMPAQIEAERRQIEQERQGMQAEQERLQAEQEQRPPRSDNKP